MRLQSWYNRNHTKHIRRSPSKSNTDCFHSKQHVNRHQYCLSILVFATHKINIRVHSHAIIRDVLTASMPKKWSLSQPIDWADTEIKLCTTNQLCDCVFRYCCYCFYFDSIIYYRRNGWNFHMQWNRTPN